MSWFTGTDIRHWSSHDQQLKALGISSPPLTRLVPQLKRVPLSRQLRNLRRSEMWADAIFSQPGMSGLAIRPYHHLFVPINLDLYRYAVPKRKVPVILHAPSHRSYKGTPEILSALAALRRKGIRFDLRLLEDVPNAVVRDALSDADIAIDQIHSQVHGVFAAEAMASGCAVAGSDRTELEPYPVNRPIWHLEPSRIQSDLETLITNLELRVRIARQARLYVLKHHDNRKVARLILARVRNRNGNSFVHNPEFFSRQYRLPKGVMVPKYIQVMTQQIARKYDYFLPVMSSSS